MPPADEGRLDAMPGKKRKRCDKCGEPMPGPMLFDFTRSEELHAKQFVLWELGGYKPRPKEKKVVLCRRCVREIERLLYNWWNNLSLDHDPFF